jgi:hypothetical protein
VSSGITVLGAGATSVLVDGPVVLQNSRGGTLVLSGMKISFSSRPPTPTHVLSLLGSGDVVLADLVIESGHATNAKTTTEAAALHVEKSSVIASRVTARGPPGTAGPGPVQPGTGGAGIACLGSTLSASGCTFTGGAGGPSTQGTSAPGGEGCFADESFLVLDGTSALGGAGATFTPSAGGDGVRIAKSTLWVGSSAADWLAGGNTSPNSTTIPPGLRVTSGSSAFHWGTTFMAGSAGGQPIVFERGTIVSQQSHPALTGTSPVPRGGTAVYTVHGESGKAAVLFLALDVAPLTVPGIETPVWLPGPRGLLLFLGAVVVGNGGTVDVRLPVPLDPSLADRIVAVEGIGWLDGPPVIATGVAVTVIR